LQQEGRYPGGDAGERAVPGSGRLPAEDNNFDYIRLFAATQVVVLHSVHELNLDAPAWVALLKPFSGVPIFFVVSGFLITASYERSSSLLSYAEKRARRIFPGLWACVLVTSLVLVALGYPLLTLQGAAWFVSQLAGLIYTPAVLRSFGFGTYNGSLWTIVVELQFYATVPVLSLVVGRVRDRRILLASLLAVAILVALLIRLQVPSTSGMFEGPESLPAKLLRYSFVTHYFLFLLGATAFYLSLHTRPWLRGRALPWLALLLAIYFLAPASVPTIVVGQIVLGLLTIAAAHTAIGPNRLKGTDISYGVYLFHGLILSLFVEFGWVGNVIFLYAVLFGAYLAGWLSWTLIERRALRREATRSVAQITV
jgi:peptidoglycan/LPS O-acetylase OafA/YrhL